MSDFLQNGVITTLHRLRDQPVEQLESELVAFSGRRPMALILPCLYSELEGPAMPHIVDELAKVPYLEQIVVGLDRASPAEFDKARKFFSRLPQDVSILWNDGPRLQAIDRQLSEAGLAPRQLGKGRNVWYCMGHVLACDRVAAVALHDCDILTYKREIPARLLYPLVHPRFNYTFCKGYYARVTEEKLNGRVTRLFYTPMVKALTRIIGHVDYLEFLASFRYALSGEFAMQTEVVREIRIPSDWGLEVGVLSEVYRNYSNKRICQVDIADHYDHKHQPLSAGDPDLGLSRMSRDIAKSIYRKLATQGITFSNEFFRTIKATYFRTALDYVEHYAAEAAINGLSFDRHAEEEAIEVFVQSIIDAGQDFLANPLEAPFIPNWNRVVSALPEVGGALIDAVRADA
ncbi:MAG: glycosyl transferase [Pseudomonadota bacterium]|nr:glycosyl transferase [Pseudomonadota bacterium]